MYTLHTWQSKHKLALVLPVHSGKCGWFTAKGGSRRKETEGRKGEEKRGGERGEERGVARIGKGEWKEARVGRGKCKRKEEVRESVEEKEREGKKWME